MNPWEELLDSDGWRALVALYSAELDGLRANLIGTAAVSSDPDVRAIANRIRAIQDLLARPEQEAYKAQKAQEAEG